jgi:hypothetical protein
MKKTKIVQKDCCDRQGLHGKVVMVTYTITGYVTVTVTCYLCYMLFDVHLCMYIMLYFELVVGTRLCTTRVGDSGYLRGGKRIGVERFESVRGECGSVKI